MAKKRKPRKDIVKKVDLLKPLSSIDILKFGTDEDPCFGKLFDLTEDPCRRCGDSTLCQIVSNQKTVAKREEVESNNRFKDLELDDFKAKALIKKLRKKKTSDEAIKNKLERRFGYEPKKIKQLLKGK
jgi:hypothetical protein